VTDGVTGGGAAAAAAVELAAASLGVHVAGLGLGPRTADWFESNAARLSLSSSLETVLEAYA
jgi:hypothetical protein